MKNEFEIVGLGLKYPYFGERVLLGIDLKIEQGSFNILLGQNGSGKSSLMKCLAGIQNWTAGDILRRGVSRLNDAPDFNKGLLFISEDIVLPLLSIRSLMKIYSEIWGSFDEELFQRMLAYAGIKDSKYATQLSRGQKALLQLSLAMAAGIETLLIDEITAVLDPFVRARVVDELVKYNRNCGATILVATNIATEFIGLDVRVILLSSGKIYLEGVLSRVVNEFVKLEFEPASEIPKSVVELPSRGGRRRGLARAIDSVSADKVIDEPIELEEIFIFLSERRSK